MSAPPEPEADARPWPVPRPVTLERRRQGRRASDEERGGPAGEQDRAERMRLAHDLTSPLAAILLSARMLAHTRQAAAEDLALIEHNVKHALELLDVLATPGGAQPHVCVRLGGIVADTVADLRPLSSGRPVLVRAAAGDLAVLGDAVALRRLVTNLVANALTHALDGPVEVDVKASAGYAVVAVSDRGPGVPAEHRERIFQPGVRLVGPPGRGSGQGLAIARAIAADHGGTLRYRSRLDGGACFELHLPLATAGSPGSAPAAS